MAELTQASLTILGAKLTYVEKGSGSPVILIHGGGPGASGISNYRRNIDELAKKHRVIVPDLPGYGDSDNVLPDGSLLTALSAVMFAFMDELGIEKADLVGNSLGGGTALKMALLESDRVGSLVLMGPGGSLPAHSPMPTEGLRRMQAFYAGTGPSIEKMRQVLELLVFDTSIITDELLAERLKAATRPDVVNNPPLRRGLAHNDDKLWRAPLENLQNETLLVWGRDDRVMPLDCYVPLLKNIPNAHLHVFPKCGHWAQWERADEFNALVLGFLEEK